MRFLAWIVCLVGIGVGWYGLTLDTTVPTGIGEGRVVNFSKMENRRMLLWIAGGMIVLGVVAEAGVRRRRRDAAAMRPSTPPPQRTPKIDPDDWQNQHTEISQQRADWGAKTGSHL